jgi:hypothetical protein
VRTGEGVELVRQGEDQVRIRHREQLGQAGAPPAVGRLLLAARQWRLRQECQRHCSTPQPSQRSRSPPRAAVRHAAMARQALACPLLKPWQAR